MHCRLLDCQLTRNFAKLSPNAANSGDCSIEPLLSLLIGQGELSLLDAWARSCFELLPGSGQCVAFIMDQLLDAQRQLDFATAVEPLSGAALVGLEVGKLRLPEAENIRLDAADAGNLADPEVEPVRNFRRRGREFFGGLPSHTTLQNGA